MTRITINNVKNALGIENSYDIVNAIRNSATEQFQNYVPLANLDNVAEVGAGITINQTVQNEFITALVDRIGLVVIRSISLNNPLKKFKKGTMPLGRTIEEIFVDITQEKLYDPQEAENTVFKREIPDVKTLFHERNRQGYYQQTIQDDSLKTAFVSWGNFDSFLSRIIQSIYNSSEVDEFEYMKLIMDNYYAKGHFKVVSIGDISTESGLMNMVKKFRSTARKMTLPMGSREYNSMGVRTVTDYGDLHLIISADLEARMDVDVLARAFNMSKTDFIGNVTVIDGFESTGLEAVLIDRDFFMVYDTLVKMETIRNPKGLYWNYFYHIWQVLSASRFQNAVAFVSGAIENPLTEITVTPSITTAKLGSTINLKALLKTVEGVETGDVTWAWSTDAPIGEIKINDADGVEETTVDILPEAVVGKDYIVKVTASVGAEESKHEVSANVVIKATK